MGIVIGILWVLLVISMLLLIAVILLQEGKGGGLAEAFGGAGAETFGVKAAGINKFTTLVGTIFLLLCIVLTKVHRTPEDAPLLPDYQPPAPKSAPGIPPGAGGPPSDGSLPPGGN